MRRFEESVRRDWRRYSKDALCSSLSQIKWHLGVEGVQSYWNVIENALIEVVDKLAPLVFVGDQAKDSNHPNVVKKCTQCQGLSSKEIQNHSQPRNQKQNQINN